MGEIAELMINGDICEVCGVELEGEGAGFPRRCMGCGGKTPEQQWDEEDEDVS
jgi:tRNA(Ile2) C34 agmatinyltransferase TiaS